MKTMSDKTTDQAAAADAAPKKTTVATGRNSMTAKDAKRLGLSAKVYGKGLK